MYNSYNQPPPQPPNRNLFQQQTGFVGQNQQPTNSQLNAGFGQYPPYYVQQPSQQQPQQQPQQTGYLQQTPLQVQLQSQQATQAPNSQLPNMGGTQTFGQGVNALNPQKTGFYMQQSQQPMEPLKPTATGFVNSFTNNGVNTELKIPLYRLSFITPADQAKFESLFRSFVKKGSNTISGQDCRTVLLRSGLNPSQLARIWALCDTNKAGELLFPEFALAMHLVNRVLQNEPIPYELTTKEKNEVEGFIDAINFSVGTQYSSGRSTPFDDAGSGHGSLKAQNTGFLPQTSFGAPILQTTGGMAMGSMYMPQSTFGQNVPLQQQQQSNTYSARPSLQPNTTGPLQSQMTGGFQRQMGGLQSQLTGGALQQMSGGLQSQLTGGALQQMSGGLQSQLTGGALQQLSSGLQSQLTGGMPLRNDANLGIQNLNILPQTGGTLNTQNTGGMLSQHAVSVSGPMAGGFPLQSTGSLQGQRTGGVPGQGTGGMNSFPIPALQSSFTGGDQSAKLQPQVTGPLQTHYTGGIQGAQITGGGMPQLSFGQNIQPNPTGVALRPETTGVNVSAVQAQPSSFLPSSHFAVTAPLTSQKTGFGNNEIYNNTNFAPVMNNIDEDKLTSEESSLFYKIFETYDTEGSGQLNFKVAAEIFRKSGLNRSDLEHIWNLCDTNSSGSLDKQEFALGMHLIYRKLNGHPLPSFLPPNLVPSSTRILDNVKQQLKGASNAVKKQPTRIDGLAYKNNDDDEILPSFRNRRKTSSIEQQQKDENKSIIEQLQRSIDEKSSQLTSAKAQLQQLIEVQGTRDSQAQQRIEHIKSQISSLPVQNSELTGVPEDLKLRFESLANKIPTLFNNISRIDDEISNTKVHLFRLRNPSTVIGSGPNGEITENDQKKAKQKALLAARMAALTGNSVDAPSDADLEREEKRYNQEISKIKEEHAKNRKIIDDIKSSITEISTPVSTAIYGCSESIKGNDPSKEKWELGIGLEPEVFDFLKHLREKAQSAAEAQISQSGYGETGKRSSYQTHSAASSSTTSGVLNSASNVFNSASNVLNSASNPTVDDSSLQGTQNPQSSSAFTGSSSPSEVAGYGQQLKSKKQEEDKSDDEEDEEERQLREQLEALKLKRKNQKEARIAKLRQNELSRSDMTGNSSGSWEEEQTTSQHHTPAYVDNRQTGTAFATDNSSTTNVSHFTQPPYTQTNRQVPAPAAENLSNGDRTGSISKVSSFKSADSSVANFDLKAAEQQRRLQRGLDDDNDWSDDEPSNDANQNVEPPAVAEKSPAVPTAASPVPVAPPLPQILASRSESAKRLEDPPRDRATPNHSAVGLAALGAPPEKAVPIAPPLPQLGDSTVDNHTTGAPGRIGDNRDDDSDVLSIPESVESEDEFRTPEFPNIPPPPPLPY